MRRLLLLLPLAGCAVNLSEARPARVLRGGEVQVTEANNVVVPLRVAKDVIKPGRIAAKAVKKGEEPSTDEERDVVGSAAAIALTGPGLGSHIDLGYGLGYHYDAALRVGNGIYALALRRGFDLGNWDASIGVRGAYNTGQSFFSYLDDINDIVKVTEMHRYDGQLVGEVGREWGEWLKLWLGGKAMLSRYDVSLNATRLGVGTDVANGTLAYYGGFFGFAVGYRWIYFVGELNAYYQKGSVRIFDQRYALSGLTLAPTWGFQGSF